MSGFEQVILASLLIYNENKDTSNIFLIELLGVLMIWPIVITDDY